MKKLLILIGIVTLANIVALAQADIRKVDFNNFTYTYQDVSYTVHNGEYNQDDPNDESHFSVVAIHYGDMSGDGIEEAVVTTNLNTGGTGQFSDGWVYQWRGKPVAIANLPSGDRADGGVFTQRMANGILFDERFGETHSGACCPEFIESNPLKIVGNRVVSAGRVTRRAYISVENEASANNTAKVELRFLKATSSSTVEADARATTVVVFKAHAGQKVTISEVDGRGSVRLMDGTTPLLSDELPKGRSVVLPRDGEFQLTFRPRSSGDAPEYLSFRITIS